MTDRNPPGANPLWFTGYWLNLQDQILDHPRRRIVVDTLRDNRSTVFTTSSLAAEVEPRLQDQNHISEDRQYEQDDINEFIAHHERSGLCTRVPKINKDREHVVVPIRWILDWLSSHPLTEEHPTSYPSGPTACVVYYLGSEIQAGRKDNSEGASPLPLEAVAYATAQQHAVIEDPDVSVNIGSLKAVREETEILDDHLSFDVDLPEPGSENEGWSGQEGCHDYAITFEISTINDVLRPEQLRRALNALSIMYAAAAKEAYYNLQNAKSRSVKISPINRGKRESKQNQDQGTNQPVRKLDFDLAVDESTGTCYAGYYTLDNMTTKTTKVDR